MSFIKKLKKSLTAKKEKDTIPSPDVDLLLQPGKLPANMENYDKLETDLQWDFLESILEPLKIKYQGRFIRKNEEEELALNLTFKGIPTRMLIDVSDPETEVFMKFENKTGTLRLYFDPDYKKDEGDDDWSDNEQKAFFISEGLYFEEYPEDFDAMKSLTDTLPPDYKTELAAAIKTLSIGYLTIDSALIEADTDICIPDITDIPGYFESLFALMEKTVNIFSSGDRKIKKLASVYIHGVAVRPGQQLVTCSYCDSTVIIGSDSTCPNCGGTIKP